MLSGPLGHGRTIPGVGDALVQIPPELAVPRLSFPAESRITKFGRGGFTGWIKSSHSPANFLERSQCQKKKRFLVITNYRFRGPGLLTHSLVRCITSKKRNMHPYSPIRVIDGRKGNVSARILHEVETGRNFVVILSDIKDLEESCEKLQCALDRFERLHKWGIHGLADVLELKDYRELNACHRNFPVFLFEQLNLALNRPPARKPFILYCEARGIVSEHQSLEETAESLLFYLESFNRAKLYPLAGIYEFRDDEWKRVKRLT
jgi:hypothetical protein